MSARSGIFVCTCEVSKPEMRGTYHFLTGMAFFLGVYVCVCVLLFGLLVVSCFVVCLFVCLFACFLGCLFVCLFVCLLVS